MIPANRPIDTLQWHRGDAKQFLYETNTYKQTNNKPKKSNGKTKGKKNKQINNKRTKIIFLHEHDHN